MTLNTYRNQHYQLLNQFKKKYSKQIEDIFSEYDKATSPINISLYMMFKGIRRRDLDNHGMMVIKVLQDALVNVGFIEDDNTDYIQSISIRGETGCEEEKIIVRINECVN